MSETHRFFDRRFGRRTFLRGAALGTSWVLLPRAFLQRAEAAPAGAGEWLAGDLHVHTVFSHDVWGGPDDDNTGLDQAYTLGWSPGEQIAIAESRDLDFLAITDHDDVRSLSDPGYHSSKLTLIPGYEHSLSKGHAGCLGITQTFKGIDTSTDAGALTLRDAVHAAGGTFILNHPFYDKGWGYTGDVRPDSVEVWNIAWPYRKPIFQGVATSENYKSLPYWEQTFLSTGKMPATGGSDNHWRSTTAAQGVGQPCTWVYAQDRSWRSIVDAIVAGRTSVSAEPPALRGARVFLTAKAGPDRWMVGDTVSRNAGKVLVRVDVVGAPGNTLKLVVDGKDRDPIPVTSADFTYTLRTDASALSRIRAEVYVDEGYWMTAITSPIYFG